MYRAVLFDLDGTLLDTIDDLADSANAVLAGMGMPGYSREVYKYYVGDGMKNLGARALTGGKPETADPARVEEFVRLMHAEYDARWDVKTRPYPGIPELLDVLTARGVKLAVLSNKPDDFTRLVVSRLLPRWKFDAVLGAREGFPIKPDPEGVFEIVRRIGVTPPEILYIGDTATDMKTAKAAGCFALGALWGFRTREELEANGAGAVIAEPLKAAGYLDGI